jgi:hypothetical protein
MVFSFFKSFFFTKASDHFSSLSDDINLLFFIFLFFIDNIKIAFEVLQILNCNII